MKVVFFALILAADASWLDRLNLDVSSDSRIGKFRTALRRHGLDDKQLRKGLHEDLDALRNLKDDLVTKNTNSTGIHVLIYEWLKSTKEKLSTNSSEEVRRFRKAYSPALEDTTSKHVVLAPEDLPTIQKFHRDDSQTDPMDDLRIEFQKDETDAVGTIATDIIAEVVPTAGDYHRHYNGDILTDDPTAVAAGDDDFRLEFVHEEASEADWALKFVE